MAHGHEGRRYPRKLQDRTYEEIRDTSSSADAHRRIVIRFRSSITTCFTLYRYRSPHHCLPTSLLDWKGEMCALTVIELSRNITNAYRPKCHGYTFSYLKGHCKSKTSIFTVGAAIDEQSHNKYGEFMSSAVRGSGDCSCASSGRTLRIGRPA
jgi:hypothetical protein